MEFKMIVGLGNPGPTYENTYHNAGFLMLDHMLEGTETHFKHEPSYTVAQIGGLLYVKPLSFMNESGRGVAEAARYFRVPPERIMVLHDDADIELGSFKVRQGGGAGGHHGIESITEMLGSATFWRMKIGIRRTPEESSENAKRVPAMDIVLRTISAEDKKILYGVFAEAAKSARNVMENEMP